MKNQIAVLLAVFFQVLGVANAQHCTPDARYTEVQYFDSSEITIGTNIQYGIAMDYLGYPDTLLMDFYYPNLAMDTASKRPFVLLFHGGGFSSGDKQSGDIQDLCVQLALRGFVCASVNYRLGHDFSEYGQYKARYRAIQDGNAAMRFVVNNASMVRIDTNWLFVGGQSAGSLIALGMVYADQFELDSISLLYSATATSIELGGLNTSGNTLSNSYSIKGIFNNWGGIVDTEVDADEMLPTISFHGELDTIVQIDADNTFLHYTLNGSRAIHYNLVANGVCSEITIDTTGEHGIFRNASSVFRAQRASCFFKSIFCNTCSDLYTTDSIPSNCSALSELDDHWGGELSVYPNPFDDSFTITGLDGIVELSVYNSLGTMLHKDKNNIGNVELELAPGVYFLNIFNPRLNARVTRTLIKH